MPFKREKKNTPDMSAQLLTFSLLYLLLFILYLKNFKCRSLQRLSVGPYSRTFFLLLFKFIVLQYVRNIQQQKNNTGSAHASKVKHALHSLQVTLELFSGFHSHGSVDIFTPCIFILKNI